MQPLMPATCEAISLNFIVKFNQVFEGRSIGVFRRNSGSICEETIRVWGVSLMKFIVEIVKMDKGPIAKGSLIEMYSLVRRGVERSKGIEMEVQLRACWFEREAD